MSVVFTDKSHTYNGAQHITDAQQIFIQIKAIFTFVLGKVKIIDNIYLVIPMCQILCFYFSFLLSFYLQK